MIFKKNKTKLIFWAIIGIIAFFVYLNYLVNSQNSSDTNLQEVTIQQGQGSGDISYFLKDEGLIKSAYAFQYYVWKEKISSQLKSGEYNFAKNLTIKEISEILFRGPGANKEVTLTFIEGWNAQQIGEYLVEKGFAHSVDDFYNVIQKKASWWDKYDVLDSRPRSQDLEGYLFPDTYRVFRDASLEDVIEKMVATLDQKFSAELKVEIKNQNKTIHDILTLASILEKEVRSSEERKNVAGIFYNRLEINMSLQADSTVNYVTGKSVSRASFKDLEADSPYNTYKYRGLPPGPISSPALSAIEAAIYPNSHNYLYFLTTPKGEVIYNESFEGHVAAKQKYY